MDCACEAQVGVHLQGCKGQVAAVQLAEEGHQKERRQQAQVDGAAHCRWVHRRRCRSHCYHAGGVLACIVLALDASMAVSDAE